jgi:hypothetical protein
MPDYLIIKRLFRPVLTYFSKVYFAGYLKLLKAKDSKPENSLIIISALK